MGESVLGVDVGGTFTDLVVWDGARIRTGKVSSTPDQSEAVVAGASEVTEGEVGRFLHGTTVATNALLERKGARTALITTEGFADVIEIARQDRPSLYDSSVDRPQPLVPRGLRFEVPRDSDEDDSLGALGALSGLDVEAFAVSLLYGYSLGDRESAIAAALEAGFPDAAVALSSRVAPEFREYERTSTTVLNAYLQPRFGSYLEHLVDRATAAGLPADISVMRSSGGLLPAGTAAELPVSALLSGPAGGVVAAAALGEALGRTRLISFDMGGTSTDVCRIDDGRPDLAYGRDIDGYACLQPSVAIHTVGAGGGSVAWRDAGGSLRVGPQSAGAHPGPAAYGRGGTEPTVTDANVALGRIDPDGSLAGRLRLHADLARDALATVGEALGMDVGETALGVTRVVEEVMAGALRKVSIEQGADPRESTLVAFGGAGGLHATSLARALDMSGVVVPSHAGVFSALGLLLSASRVDEARSIVVRQEEALRVDVAVADAARAAEAASPVAGETRTYVDVRYLGQSHELTVPYDPGDGWDTLADRFHRMHQRRNGFARPDDPIEAVTVRAEAVGDPALPWEAIPAPAPYGDSRRGTRTVLTSSGPAEAKVWWRSGLRPGDEIVGPAVVEEAEATTFLDVGDRAVVHETGALEIEW